MKKILHIFTLLLAMAFTEKTAAQTYNVSPGPNALENAKAWVAANAPSMTQDLTVNLGSGIYGLGAPFTLDDSHSGRNGHRVIWRSTTENGARINGGRRVTGWQTTPDGLWKASVPGASGFRHLWSGSGQGTRARHPNKGKRYSLLRWESRDKRLVVRASEIARWNNPDKIEMVVQKWWAESRFFIGDYTVSGSEATITPTAYQRKAEWASSYPFFTSGQGYYFENALELIDEAGEWYFNDDTKELYYKPRAGESIGSADIWITEDEELMNIDGANDVTFEGITFEYSHWPHPSENGLSNDQAGFYRSVAPNGNVNSWTVMPSSINIKNSDNLVFRKNVFRRMGKGGVELSYGTTNTLFEGNVFDEIAGNGVLVFNWLREFDTKPRGYPNTPVPLDKYCLNDRFVNNYFVRNGITYQGAVPVVGFYPKGMVVDNNEIAQAPYTGISMGVGWTLNTTILSDNKIRRNYIHDVMYRNTDGGGIYTLSEQQGTVISENFVEDLIQSAYAENDALRAYYLDQGSGGITLADNVGKNLAGGLIRVQTNSNGTGTNYISGNGNSNPAVEANAGIIASYQYIKNKVPAAVNPGTGAKVTAASDPPPGGASSDNLNFENGDFLNWNTVGTVTITSSNTFEGTFAAAVGTTTTYGQLSRTISGLSPNTEYNLRVWARAAGGKIFMKAENFGGSPVSQSTTSNSYVQLNLNFTTGATNSSVSVVLWSSTSTPNSYGYFDDLSVNQSVPVFPDPSKWYVLESKADGRYLGNNTTTNDALVWPADPTEFRQYRFEESAINGYYNIISRVDGRFLGNQTQTANAVFWPATDTDYRRWEIRPSGVSGYFNLVSKIDGLYVGNKTQTNDAVMWPATDTDYRRWKFIVIANVNGPTTALKSSFDTTANNFDISNLELYPNPSSDILNVELPMNHAMESYSVVDSSGRKIMDGVFSGSGQYHQINLSGLPNGLYIIKIVDNVGVETTRKIIKN